MEHARPSQFATSKKAFGAWLLDQAGRQDEVGQLAGFAKNDPRFPKAGDFQAVSRRLNELQADPEYHYALEEAELDWAAH